MNERPRRGVVPPPPPEGPASILRRKARRFDVPALLDALRDHFPELPVRFQSHPSATPQPTVIEDVEVRDDHVMVTVNLGLFSARTALPSYFERLLHDPTAGESLRRILATFDHALLELELGSFRPESCAHFVPDPARLRRRLLASSRPASPATLDWIFRAVFPELGVSVRRAALERTLPGAQARVGTAVLGVATLGPSTTGTTSGFHVRLSAHETSAWHVELRAEEARRRLDEVIVPALSGTRLRLRVVLTEVAGGNALALASTQRLGLATLGSTASTGTVMLFDGVVT